MPGRLACLLLLLVPIYVLTVHISTVPAGFEIRLSSVEPNTFLHTTVSEAHDLNFDTYEESTTYEATDTTTGHRPSTDV